MKNYLGNLTSIVFNAPIWVQEVIYFEVKKNLEKRLPNNDGVFDEDDVYSLFVPQITFKGKKELETREHGLDFNIYRLLESALGNARIADITLDNFWSLEQTSLYLSECLEREFVVKPQSDVVSAYISYLAGKIRLGEYVKRLNKINIDDLDDVLRKQKNHNEENPDDPQKIGEFLINMGYIANNDIDKILQIKDEAQKRFMLSGEVKVSCQNENVDCSELQEKVQKLTAENNLLKDKLRAIFNIQNKNK